MYCATTTSISIPSSCAITVRVTANCDNVFCTSATCSSVPSDAVVSN
jgi:hypothetical protein